MRNGGRGSAGPPRITTATVLAMAGIGVLLWIVGDVLLALFAGVLIAVALDALASVVAERTPIGRLPALALVTLLVAALVISGPLFLLPVVIDQIGGVWDRLATLADRGLEWAQDHPVLGEFLSGDDISDAAPETAQIAGQIASLTMTVANALALAVIVVATGLFLAFDPGLYTRGFLRLVPPRSRDRWAETLASTGYALRWWLLGQLVSMSVLFVVTSTGLWLFGLDLWLGLGILTGIFTFVPFLGPAIAAIPILLIGFSEGIGTGLGVAAFYLVVQNLEGTVLTPLIQQRAVRLPPAVLISSQVLMGALFGIPGLILAAPLTAVAMIATNLLYIEGVLGEPRATPQRRIFPHDDKTPSPDRDGPDGSGSNRGRGSALPDGRYSDDRARGRPP